jgi:hypothetical protein
MFNDKEEEKPLKYHIDNRQPDLEQVPRQSEQTVCQLRFCEQEQLEDRNQVEWETECLEQR